MMYILIMKVSWRKWIRVIWEREREREDGGGGKAVLGGVVMNGLIVALIS